MVRLPNNFHLSTYAGTPVPCNNKNNSCDYDSDPVMILPSFIEHIQRFEYDYALITCY